jgi:murein DD-endopeptidase MepM/ murein hydrolase activator NlpD
VSALTAILIVMVACVLVSALTLIALVATPLATYVSIPNPELEQRYKREVQETQRRLGDLYSDVEVLKRYNMQLRRALGDHMGPETALAKTLGPPRDGAQDESRSSLAEQGTAGFEPATADRLGRMSRTVRATPVLAAHDRETELPFPLLPPVDAFVSQRFDPSRGHFGIDYAGKEGSPVYAAADGEVVFAGWTYDDGNMLIISHGPRYLTVYKHNQTLFKTSHTSVKRGEAIGLIGTSGQTSLGPHLHFEIWKDGVPENPEDYLITIHKNR